MKISKEPVIQAKQQTVTKTQCVWHRRHLLMLYQKLTETIWLVLKSCTFISYFSYYGTLQLISYSPSMVCLLATAACHTFHQS